jgi:peptidoglycan/LPS O-acetylase OafA/YrhL
MRRMVGLRVLSGIFALFAAAEVIQLIQAGRGEHPDPPVLLLTHVLTGVVAGLAAFGLWRGRSWAPVAVLGWGILMVAMLVALGPILDEPGDAWRGYWLAAVVVGAFAAGSAWYARNQTRRPG